MVFSHLSMMGAPASLNKLIVLYSGLLYGAGGSCKSVCRTHVCAHDV